MKNYLSILFFLLLSQLVTSQNLNFNPYLKPFYHGIASGDPLEDRVIIWTRVTPEFDTTISGTFVMATDTKLKQIVKTGNFITDQSHDYTVKIDVGGLNPNTTYYFAFYALGNRSIIGRTKTTPSVLENNINNVLKFAVVACPNYEGGFFNSCGLIADRNDLNAVIHLGDYIYEYAPGEYRNINLTDSTRTNIPPNELLTLKDYRTRYSLYNLDSNLLRMRQQHPLIAVWDDHEFAVNAYDVGAVNHQPGEGDWEDRKRIAKEAYFEWMPVRGNPENTHLYRTISYGKLMDLFMLDTRMDGRQKQPETFDAPDDTLNPRRMISAAQYNWLINNLKNSQARWKVIGNQVVFSNFNVGFAGENPTSYDDISLYENLFIDSWEGYLLQRNAIIDSLQANELKNVVFLTGDSHCSWAFDVTKEPVLYPLEQYGYLPQPNLYNPVTKQGYNPATGEGSHAVEFCTPSISAENYAETLGSDSIASLFEYFFNNPLFLLPGSPNYNPHAKYVDLDRHGYMIFDVRADSAQADFFYTPSVTTVSKDEIWGNGLSTAFNSNHITTFSTSNPAPPKDIQDIPAPFITRSIESGEPVIFSMYPNPASNFLHILFGVNITSDITISITNLSGQLIKSMKYYKNLEGGLHSLRNMDVSDLEAGIYILQIKAMDKMASRKLVIK